MRFPRLSLSLLAAALVATLLPIVASAQVFQLSGRQLVPAVAGEATGRCAAVVSGYFEPGSQLILQCTHDLADEVVSAQVRLGEPGSNGPVVFNFPDPGEDMPTGIWTLTSGTTVDLLLGRLYVVLGTAGQPSGALRGQVVNLPIPGDFTWLYVPVTEGGVPLAEGGIQRGVCIWAERRNFPDESVLVIACRHQLASPLGAELRAAESGTRYDLHPTGASPFVWSDTWSGGPSIPLLWVEDMEIVFEHAGGEISGLVRYCPHDDRSLCLNRERFLAVVYFRRASGMAAAGRPVPLTRDSGLFWFFNPENQEMLVKVLDGCAVNDHYWVFFAATTNVQFELFVADAWTLYDPTKLRTKNYFNPQGHAAEPVLDTEAFPCP